MADRYPGKIAEISRTVNAWEQIQKQDSGAYGLFYTSKPYQRLKIRGWISLVDPFDQGPNLGTAAFLHVLQTIPYRYCYL